MRCHGGDREEGQYTKESGAQQRAPLIYQLGSAVANLALQPM
jgi:hypothetical protein